MKPPPHITLYKPKGILQIYKLEFMMYILDHHSIADMAEMESICKVFDARDVNGESVLHMQNTRRRRGDTRRLQNVHVKPTFPISGQYEAAHDNNSPAASGCRLAKHLLRPESRRAPPSEQAPLLPIASYASSTPPRSNRCNRFLSQ